VADPSEFTWRQVQEARSGLEEFRISVSRFVNTNGIQPSLDSPARLGMDRFPHPGSVETVYSQALLLIEVAADQLTAFLKTTEPPFETIAPWTCVRALLEASALGCWLLQPGIPMHSRVGRSIALRYEGLQHQRKFIGSLGKDPSETVERIDFVLEQSQSMGFDPVMDRKNRRHIGAGERLPSSTDLIASQLGEEAMYRLLSAVAHGHSWAIHQLGFQFLPSASQLPKGSPGSRYMTKGVTPLGYLYLAVGCAKGFGRVTWNQCLYAGWDETEMASMLSTLFERVGAEEHARFWH